MHAIDFRAPEYFVTFIPFPGGVRFLWVKRVIGAVERRVAMKPEYPFQEHYEMDGVTFDLERIPAFNDYEGRAIFDWNRGLRGYDVWHDRTRPNQLIELLSPDALSGFRGYAQTFLSIHELRQLTARPDRNLDWRSALAAVSGVYLITDMSDGALYVGSAYGLDGLLARFTTYAAGPGHGNNALLRRRLTEFPNAIDTWRWSILEAMPIDATANEVIAREQFQKIRLGSRAFGLNAN
jgi:hypothetical protein